LIAKGQSGFSVTSEWLEGLANGTAQSADEPPMHHLGYECERKGNLLTFDDIFHRIEDQKVKILPNCDTERLTTFFHKIREWEEQHHAAIQSLVAAKQNAKTAK
jgi:hypothetical protein